MRSVMAWFRIEPQSDDPQPGPDRALQARVYDPAWLLGRQWQLGELTGEDAASPAWVRLRMTGAPISRLQLRGATEVHRVAPADLIEPLVEGEAEQDAEWIRSVEAGQHFLAALDAAGLGAEFGTAFRTAYPVLDPDSQRTDPESAVRFRVLSRRGMDGLALAAAARGPDGAARLPDRPAVSSHQDELLAPVAGVVPGTGAGRWDGLGARAARVSVHAGRAASERHGGGRARRAGVPGGTARLDRSARRARRHHARRRGRSGRAAVDALRAADPRALPGHAREPLVGVRGRRSVLRTHRGRGRRPRPAADG